MNLVTSGDRERRVFVGDLTRKEFREKMEAGTIKAGIIPTAATEQHNEHLEMIHDTLHATYMAEQTALRLFPQVVVASPISIGVSEHWMKHIGTLTVRPEIFCEYVFDVCNSLARAGINNLLILNGHGGNVKPLMRRIDEFRDRLGADVNIRFQSYWDVYDEGLVQKTMEHGRLPGHADEYETSTMMVLAPERIHADDIDNEPSKVASKQKGEALIEPVIAGVSSIIEKMIAGEKIDQPPVTFRPEGRLHMTKGEAV
jgi:creatinine amidohydrolase